MATGQGGDHFRSAILGRMGRPFRYSLRGILQATALVAVALYIGGMLPTGRWAFLIVVAFVMPLYFATVVGLRKSTAGERLRQWIKSKKSS